jgi:magnesium chelatase family protein
LLCRIDIQIPVPAVPYRDFGDSAPRESAASIRERIVQARTLQGPRFPDHLPYVNARMLPRQVESHCRLDSDCKAILEIAITHLGLSARGWNRILKRNRTTRCAGQIARQTVSEKTGAVQMRVGNHATIATM